MRTIVIIQSIIILVGAYYIYTLVHNSEPSMVIENNIEESSNDLISEMVETDTVPVNDVDISTESLITGPNDVGMEFPIPDDESLLEM